MRFSQVLERLDQLLGPREIRWAVIGGIALAAHGIPRTTLDLDLLVDRESQETLISLLEAEGYSTLHRSDGYSSHLHGTAAKGRIDVVYVRDETARKIFAGAVLRRGPGDQEIRVPRPEHLSAMKITAIKNAPERAFQDLADIRNLLLLPGVDRSEVRQSFERHGMLERFDELEKTL